MTMTGTASERIDTTGRRRTLRWLLRALLAIGAMGGLGIGSLLWTVLTLALEVPRRSPVARRWRLPVPAARLLAVASLGLGPSPLTGDLESVAAAGVQSGLVFVAAFLLSRHVVPLLARR
jgi:hypothetical protein